MTTPKHIELRSSAENTSLGQCPLCANENFIDAVEVAHEVQGQASVHFRARQCLECGLAHMDPWPHTDAVSDLYRDARVFSRAARTEDKVDLIEQIYRRFGSDDAFLVRSCLRLVKRPGPLRLLDVGCSTGRTLVSFMKYAPNAIPLGLDIDPGAAAQPMAGLEGRILTGDLLDVCIDGPFDIITFKTVVEHMPRMRESIEKAAQLLAPGGVLFISTPDLGSAKARALGPSWRSLFDPVSAHGHILWFERRTLAHAGNAMGLELVRCTDRGELYWHLPEWAKRMLVWCFGMDQQQRRPITNRNLRLLYASIFDGWLSEKLNYGDTLYAFYRKAPPHV